VLCALLRLMAGVLRQPMQFCQKIKTKKDLNTPWAKGWVIFPDRCSDFKPSIRFLVMQVCGGNDGTGLVPELLMLPVTLMLILTVAYPDNIE